MAPLEMKMIRFEKNDVFWTYADLDALYEMGQVLGLDITSSEIDSLTDVVGVTGITFDWKSLVVTVGPRGNRRIVPPTTEDAVYNQGC